MVARVKETLERYSMIEKGDRILVAFSHGPDSTVLLYILNILKRDYPFDIFACYVNHGIREESREETKLAQKFCKKLNIPFTYKEIDVITHAKERGISIEMAAREMRYKVLFEVLEEIGFNKIATGHTLTDSIETFILKLTRGTSPESIYIPPVRDNIIRPLIEITREDVMRFIKDNQLPYVVDRTNFDIDIKRNFVRRKILPALKELNSSYHKSYLNFIRILKEDMDFIYKNLPPLEKIIRRNKEGWILDIATYFSYTPSIRRRLIKKVFPEMEYKDIIEIEKLKERRNGYRVNLRGNWIAIRERNVIFIGKSIFHGESDVKILDGEIKWGDYLLMKREVDFDYFREHIGDKNREFFDADSIKLPLIVRSRREGDRILKKEGYKKIKDVFIDRKIPLRERDRIPVIEDREGILWIPEVIRSYKGFINENTKRIIEISYRRIDG